MRLSLRPSTRVEIRRKSHQLPKNYTKKARRKRATAALDHLLDLRLTNQIHLRTSSRLQCSRLQSIALIAGYKQKLAPTTVSRHNRCRKFPLPKPATGAYKDRNITANPLNSRRSVNLGDRRLPLLPRTPSSKLPKPSLHHPPKRVC